MSAAWAAVLGVGLVGGAAAQMVRWLRVLQREHYDPAAPVRFLARWTWPEVGSARRARRRRPVTLSVVCVVGAVALGAAGVDRAVAAVTILYGLACPVGLSLRGRTGALRWTRRLTTVGVATGLVAAMAGAAVATARPYLVASAVVWLMPVLVALAALALAPLEDRRAQGFVDQAVARLARVAPRVVGITGSYGKTSTKSHLVDLLGPDAGVVASPRSFNNRAGLSRAINEQLEDTTRVFVAEMGTYGPGEIRALCAWCPPEVAVVTAIGPVHLERMGTLEAVEAAKFEITERARVVVLNIDDPRLAGWVERLRESGTRVRTAASRAPADVRVVEADGRWTLEVDAVAYPGVERPSALQATNVACAAAAALELGASATDVARRLGHLREVEHRAAVGVGASGARVIDDTFNANPASAAAAIALLATLAAPGRRVVVTPGLVELGAAAHDENRALGALVAASQAQLVVVARTNARSLLEGYGAGARRVDRREDAVAWVRSTLGEGDAVLYLNDLPDHYP